FDEVWVAAHGPVSGELLVRTTTDDGSEWMWAVVLPGAGQMVAPTAEKWKPSAAESMTLIRDATQLVAQLQMAGAGSYPVNAAGTAGKLEPVQLPVVTAATAPLVPVPPAAPGGVGGGGGPAVAALGLSGEVAVPSGQAPNVDLKALEAAEDGKDRQVSYSDLAHVDGLKWKKKGDLVAFAAKHPGALTAHFLAGVYARLSKGSLSRTRQLREASVASWAHQFSGLNEIRDMKEVLTMAEVLDSVNRREIERAMDILCQRILAIQAAKFKGGSWEKAEAIELVSTQKFRQAMSLRGAVTQDPMGFGAFFSAVVGSLAYSLRGDRDLSVCPGLLEGANLVVAALNSLFGGQFEAEAMVLTDEPTLSGVGLDSFLKQSEHYSGGGVVLALGVRGGVPQKAADVCLHEHLKDSFPEMADQVIRPETLLLPSKRRPRRVKRGYTWLASSYPELVRRNVRAGLHRLKKPHQVARHRGVVCLAGAFAVRKDANEDRVITDPSVNQLLDPVKLPRPRFAYIPKMRTVAVPAGGILVVSKRDARHYFHRLQIGRRWRRWLCGPPIQTTSSTGQDGFRYPASCSAPMGFGPSAGWAQGLTDVIALDAQLPPEQRLHPDTVPPSTMPVWGSIVDDVWAIEHVGSQLDAGVGASWMDAAERAWVARGVEPNSKKSIDNAMGEEVQGYYVDPLEHWVGVSLEKRRWLFQATVWVLRQRRVMVAVVDRLIGKHGFVHSARAIMRSIFEASYSWLDSVRGRRRDLVEIPRKVWVELAISALLLPFCSFNLSAEWSCRVECTDASMSGIGRAWGVVPRNVVQTIARYADHGRVYTNLSLPWSIGLTSEHKCPLRRVRIPVERIKWFTAGAQWMSSHITLGEADAVTWAAADRLRRPADDGSRFVHPLDSAACVGCFTKGRSSSRALNQRCQRMCAIGVAGGHEVFYPWVPSKENPADEPSRRWEPNDEQADEGQPEPSGELVVTGLGCWPNDSKFFIHVCSGPRRDGDLWLLGELAMEGAWIGFQWGSMNEEDQDVFLAEWVIEGFEGFDLFE
ncbi:unnamed protein product, partial [Symbiodinium sp. CCMP2456]